MSPNHPLLIISWKSERKTLNTEFKDRTTFPFFYGTIRRRLQLYIFVCPLFPHRVTVMVFLFATIAVFQFSVSSRLVPRLPSFDYKLRTENSCGSRKECLILGRIHRYDASNQIYLRHCQLYPLYPLSDMSKPVPSTGAGEYGIHPMDVGSSITILFCSTANFCCR